MKSKNVFAEAQKVCESLQWWCSPWLESSTWGGFGLKQHIPSSEGIIVRSAIAQMVKLKSQIKRAKQIAEKYSSLQSWKKWGPKWLDTAYRNRVSICSMKGNFLLIIHTHIHTEILKDT